MLLYYYYLSLVFIDRSVKSRIFLNLFSRDLTLWALRGARLSLYLTISNLIQDPKLNFFRFVFFFIMRHI